MKLLHASWLLTCDDDFSIIKNGAIVFDTKIIEVGSFKELKQKYNDIEIIGSGKNSVIMPGLINAHTHLEFSANKTTLKYGNFIQWLNSVIQNREELIEKANTQLLEETLNRILKSGTTTIGAISSYGFDMEACIKTPINVVYFSEIVGSKTDMIDTLFDDFKARLKNAKENKSDSFIPAIAIHSPYSVHPFLIREVLKIAKEQNIRVSAHFLESAAEKEWLNHSAGEFKKFFEDFLGQYKPLTTSAEFLNQFKDIKNLSFTHCVEANNKEILKIKQLNASIIHCPNSNRLLSNNILNLNNLKDVNLALGTDGLSSNYSLCLFDELKNALFMHTEEPATELSIDLIKAATQGGAKALGLNKGVLHKSYDADIISFELPDYVEDESEIAMQILLHIQKPDRIFIKGKSV